MLKNIMLSLSIILLGVCCSCNSITINVAPPSKGIIDQTKRLVIKDDIVITNSQYTVFIYVHQETPKSVFPINATAGDSAIEKIPGSPLK